MNTGAILTALMLGVLLASAASWAITALYRRRMLTLMRQAPPPRIDATAPAAPAVSLPRPHAVPDAAAQRAPKPAS